jgi:DNA-binding protein Fis
MKEAPSIPFREMVSKALDQYFLDLNGEIPVRESKGNLSLAAKTLGINRGTLRTRLHKYGLKNK